MDLFCKVCDRSIFENESEYNNYTATSRKKNDKCFYNKYTNINVNLDDVDKILNDFISTHNKNFVFEFFKYGFIIELDNYSTENKETHYFYNINYHRNQ